MRQSAAEPSSISRECRENGSTRPTPVKLSRASKEVRDESSTRLTPVESTRAASGNRRDAVTAVDIFRLVHEGTSRVPPWREDLYEQFLQISGTSCGRSRPLLLCEEMKHGSMKNRKRESMKTSSSNTKDNATEISMVLLQSIEPTQTFDRVEIDDIPAPTMIPVAGTAEADESLERSGDENTDWGNEDNDFPEELMCALLVHLSHMQVVGNNMSHRFKAEMTQDMEEQNAIRYYKAWRIIHLTGREWPTVSQPILGAKAL